MPIANENDQKYVLNILHTRKALIENSHVVYTSGKHGRSYINKDAVYVDAYGIRSIYIMMAQYAFNQRSLTNVQVIVAPAVGAVILGHGVATCFCNVKSLYAEKNSDGSFSLRRGYDREVAGKEALIVEDVLTTGGSMRAVADAVRKAGGIVMGGIAMVNRGSVTEEQTGVPWLLSMVSLPLEAWDPAECPMCKEGVQINTSVGKGAEFVRANSR